MFEADQVRKLLTGVSVSFHYQLPITDFDPGTLNRIKTFSFYDHGRRCTDVLNQEIGIWAKSFKGDITGKRIIATLSLDDAARLRDSVGRVLGVHSSSDLVGYPQYNYPMQCLWGRDEYQGIVAMSDPQVEAAQDRVALVSGRNVLIFPHPEDFNLLEGLHHTLKSRGLDTNRFD